MNKKYIAIITGGVVLVALAAAVAYMAMQNQPADQQNAEAQPEQSQAQPQEQTQPPQNQEQATQQPGAYTDYSAEKVQNTEGKKVLFFHAPWCPQCRQLEQSIKDGTIPQGVTIFKVDYDTNQELRQKYGVTIQTTLVQIDANGELVTKYVAYNEPTLQKLIENAL